MQKTLPATEIELESAIAYALRTADLQDVAVGLGEMALDSVLREGLLRDVPALGSVIGLLKTGRSVRDHLLDRKIIVFLQPSATITPAQRQKVIDAFDADPRYGYRVGERVLMLLEKADCYKRRVFSVVLSPRTVGNLSIVIFSIAFWWRSIGRTCLT